MNTVSKFSLVVTSFLHLFCSLIILFLTINEQITGLPDSLFELSDPVHYSNLDTA